MNDNTHLTKVAAHHVTFTDVRRYKKIVTQESMKTNLEMVKMVLEQ